MKINTFLFRSLTIVFFVFALVMTVYMSAHMTEEEGGSRQLLVYSFFLLDVVCAIIMFQDANRGLRGIHLVCLLWIVVILFLFFLWHQQISNLLKVILWPLLFEATYLCCKNFVSRGLKLKKIMVIIAVIGAYYFLRTRLHIEYQSNTIYLVFLTLPWLLFSSEKKNQVIILGVYSFFALISLKRSMLLTVALIWIFYFLFGMKKRRNKIYTIIFSIVLLAGIFVLYDKVDESTGGLLTERVNREETDSGRNRLAIWTLTSNMIQNSSFSKLVVGHGHSGVRRDSFLEISAHNDFMEVIYDYGLIIFILYLGLWRHVIRRAIFFYRTKSSLFLPYSASLSIFIVMSSVSHLILYATYFNYLVLFWAMTEAMVDSGELYLDNK